MAQKVKDYDAAVNALRKVSPSGQKHRLYTYYASLAYEGLGNYELALANYQKYLNFNPNNTNTINKVAEITYKLHKINPSGSWKDIKSTSGKIFNIELTGTELSIKSADGKVNITLHYTSSGADGAKRYDGFYKVPLERRFKEGSCTICGYPDGLATYCEINGTNSNIHIYTRDLNVSLDGTKAQNGIIKYKACCKSEPAADYAFIYELERNTNQSN
jgi:tetratricopeptide (TPR) repeat protein